MTPPEPAKSGSALAGFAAALPSLGEGATQRRKAADTLMSEAKSLERIIQGFYRYESGAIPRGMTAVMLLMADGQSRRSAEVHRELQRRGWVSPHAIRPKGATEMALARLVGCGALVRVGRGRYRRYS